MRWQVAFAIAVISLWLLPAYGQQDDPAAAWTTEHRDALVYIEVENRKGTGFLVKSDRGDLYVLTAAHNLFGVVDPTVASPSRPAVPARACQQVDEAAIKLRLGDIGGPGLYADCISYLGGPDIGAVRVKPPGGAPSALLVLRPGRFRDDAHQKLALLGFPFGLQRPATPETAELGGSGGPRGTIVFRATNAGGLSGSPLLSADGLVVAMHSGVLEDTQGPRPGFIAIVPLTAVEPALTEIGVRFDVPSPKGAPAVWGQVLIREGRNVQNLVPASRPARQSEAVVRVDFRNDSNGLRQSAERSLLPDGGVFVVPCPDGYPPKRETDVRPVPATIGGEYVPRSARLACTAPPSAFSSNNVPDDRQLSLTEAGRYIATQLDEASNKFATLIPQLPNCMRTPLGVLDALYCAMINQKRLETFSSQLDEIEENFTTAVANASGNMQRTALVRYARFEIRRGNPCVASTAMAQAVSGADGSVAGSTPQLVISEWADTVVACAKLQLGLDRYSSEQLQRPPADTQERRVRVVADALRALTELAEHLNVDVLNASRPRLIQFLVETCSLLTAPQWDPTIIEKRITEDADLINYWNNFLSRFIVDMCPAFSAAQRFRPISAQLTALQSSPRCSVSNTSQPQTSKRPR
jgi:hypothetical protein